MSKLTTKTKLLIALYFLLIEASGAHPIYRLYSTGHPDVDRVREELQTQPTNHSNVLERLNTMKLWMRLLSYSGADLNPVRDSFMSDGLESKLSDIDVSEAYLKRIDLQYEMLEKIFLEFQSNPERYRVDLNRKMSSERQVPRNWPTLRGDEGQTGYTHQSGPVKGELKWKFPAGHAWYATPAFSDGKVYMGSPGVSYQAYCLDAETGKFIWKTLQQEKQNQYSTPRNASPAYVVGNQVIVREIGSLGNNGPAKDLVFIDKHTGAEIKQVPASHVDYRVGYASFVATDEFIVFPQSIQEIGSNSTQEVEVVSFDNLVAMGLKDGQQKWKHFIGEFYGEPLIIGDRVYCGNYAGEMRCIDLKSGKLIWSTSTDGSINGKAVYSKDSLIIGNQLGEVYALDAVTGEVLWSVNLPVEKRAFQNFSNAAVADGSIFIGSADEHVYSIDLESGKILWELKLDDWIRSAPVVVRDQLVVATVSGAVYGINFKSGMPVTSWCAKVSDHGIYADLKQYQGKVYVPSSDFYLNNIDPGSGKINWRTSIFESVETVDGGRILADLVGGGPDYQAGTVIADGIAYFGSPRFVYAVDVESGEEVWKFETRGQVCGAPAVAKGKVFFGQQGGTSSFYCVNAKTGDLVWKSPLRWVWASPNVKDGKVYIASVAGTFFCCDQRTGEILWKYESRQGAYPAPSFMDDTVYFGSWNGKYYAFDKDNGELIWEYEIEGHPDSGSSIVMDGIFFAQGYIAKYFHAVDAISGKKLWKTFLDGEWCNASPVSDGEHVLFSTYIKPLHQAPIPSHTHCYNAKTGEKLYTIPFAGGLTGAVICNDMVFSASTTDAYMRAWDIGNGGMRWQYLMGGRAEETCVSIYGDMAFVVCTDGYLYAFE
ncbi:MAG: PQQ-binding-like beta-propeller repeat protein [Puniceicoccaceae bacterium]